MDRQKWWEANQRFLSAALDQVRLLLEQHVQQVESSAADAAQHGTDSHTSSAATGEEAWDDACTSLEAARSALPSASAIDQLTAMFALSSFERNLLLLAAGVELDTRFASRCAAAQGESRPYATFSLALAFLPEVSWAALAPTAPLRYWKLIEIGPGTALTTSALRIDERILHFLIGVRGLDERIPVTTSRTAALPLAEEPAAVALAMARAWEVEPSPVLQLHGSDRALRRAIVAAASDALRLRFVILSASALPQAAADLNTLVRLWNRETRIEDRVLLVECEDAGEADRAADSALLRFAAEVTGPLVISYAQLRPLLDETTLFFEAANPGPAWQAAEWKRVLERQDGGEGRLLPGMEDQIDRLTAQFNLTSGVIEAACLTLDSDEAAPSTPASRGAALWRFCRLQARSRLDGLAQRVQSGATWEDLILPEVQLALLHEIATQVRHRGQVYGGWGFGGLGSRGLGIAALFAGASGTGKSLAAEVLANELELDLYRIDLSAVVSKYIGETEKSLRRVFDAAEEGGAILLFDEADALFGKRSEVKDSHDRHANIEVSYLLQRMEAYRGLAILTTNLKQSLDVAFLRRLRFVVDFPFPSVTERTAIWKRSFPTAAPLEGLDMEKLGRLNMSGGNIRSISLAAAFLAAEEGTSIRMKHLLQAARGESIKLDKTLSDAETRDWI